MKDGYLVRQAQERSATRPYKSFSDSQLKAIEKALRLVWQHSVAIQQQWKKPFSSCNEVDISGVLIETFGTLYSDRDHPNANPLLAKFFEHFQLLVPDASLRDYQHKSLQKRPDFSFRSKEPPEPGVNPYYWALFVEAKIIEPSKTMYEYVSQGLVKYLDGEYGWSMAQGMMLGYVRDTEQKLPGTLNAHFHRHGKVEEYGIVEMAEACAWSKTNTRVHQSVHNRKWLHPDSHQPPGDITIYHLWLKVCDE